MKLVKALVIMMGVLAIAGACLWQFWLKDQVEAAKIGTAFAAQQVCSCRFVAERDMASCKGDFVRDVSPFTFIEDDTTITVSVLGGQIANSSTYQEGLGCMVS